MNAIVHVVADTEITTRPTTLLQVILAADAGAAAELEVRTGGAAGTIMTTLTAVAGETVVCPFVGGISMPNGVYLNLTGTGAHAMAVYR